MHTYQNMSLHGINKTKKTGRLVSCFRLKQKCTNLLNVSNHAGNWLFTIRICDYEVASKVTEDLAANQKIHWITQLTMQQQNHKHPAHTKTTKSKFSNNTYICVKQIVKISDHLSLYQNSLCSYCVTRVLRLLRSSLPHCPMQSQITEVPTLQI